VLFPSGVVYLI